MKRIIAAVLMLMLVLFCMASCFTLTNPPGDNTPGDNTPGDNDGGNNGGNDSGNSGNNGGNNDYQEPVDYGSATVFAPGNRVQVIATSGAGALRIKEALDEFLEYNDKGGAIVGNLYSQNEALEVLVNIEDVDGSRPILATADKYLQRMDKEGTFDIRYVIYAEAGQIAVVFDENEYTNLEPSDYIINILIEEFFTGVQYFASAAGVVKSGTIDLIAEQEELDVKYLKEQWDELEKNAIAKYGKVDGTRIVDAFRTYYSMIDDRVVGWWANMFDPGIGGFYGTASGRDHLGFLPNIEGTGQILGQLSACGMLDTLGGSVANALPKIIQYRIVYYYKSLQNPSNGYFYNPQLGVAGTSTYRLGRDQGRCTTWLTSFGSRPTYNHPNGTAGDGITADEYWDDLVARGLISEDEQRPYVPTSLEDYENHITGNIGDESAAAAVSKVVPTAGVEDFVASHENFANWLATWDPDRNPYSACSNVNAVYNSLIAPQSAILGPCTDEGKWYTGMTLKEMTISWFNSYINGRGLFGAYDENSTDPSAGCKYANTNGLMKAIPIYNAWKIAYPEPLKAVEGCLIGIMSDEESKSNICETYNIWEALYGVISNVQNYGTEEQKKELLGYDVYDGSTGKFTHTMGLVEKSLADFGPDAIINTFNKQKRYQCEDGGFSHNISKGGTENGGLPIGIGLKEANVDANGFGMQSVINAMLNCFGLRSYQVPLFTEADWMGFVDMILNVQPVIKYNYDEMNGTSSIDKVHTFEAGMPASGFSVSASTNFPNNTYSAVDALGKDGQKGILRITKTQTGSGSSMSLVANANVKSMTATMVTFEMDIKYSNLGERVESQIQLGTLSKTSMKQMPIFILLNSANGKDGTAIKYSDYTNGNSNSQNIDTGAKVGEWFTLKVEYFEGDLNTFRFRVYINDKLIYTSNSVYSQNMAAGAEAIPGAKDIQRATFSMNEKCLGTFEYDNVSLIQSRGVIDDMGVGAPGQTEVPEDKPTEPEPLVPGPIPEGIKTPASADAVKFDAIPDTKVTYITSQDALNKTVIADTIAGDKVLYISKQSYIDSNSGVIFRQYPTLTENDATVAVFEADLYTQEYTATGVIQITLAGAATGNANSPLMVVLNPGNSPKVGTPFKFNGYKYNTETGKTETTTQVTTDAVVGKWFRIRLEYRATATDKDGNPTAIEYKFYVNNKLVDTLTHIYGSGLTPNGGSSLVPSVSDLTYVGMSFNASNKGIFAVDNFSFRKLAQNDYVAGDLEIPDSVIGSGFTAPAGAITFDEKFEDLVAAGTAKVDLKESAANAYAVVTERGDKMLCLTKTDATKQEIFHHVNTAAAGTYGYVAYEAVLSYAPAADSKTKHLDLSFYGPDGNQAMYTLITYDSNGNLTLTAYKRVSSGTTASETKSPSTPVKAGDFFKIRVEYAFDANTALIKYYINDELLIEGDYYSGVQGADGKFGDTPAASIASVGIINYTKFTGTTLIDYSYLTTAKSGGPGTPGAPGPVVNFDSDYSDQLTITTNKDFAELNKWEVVETEGNRVLFIDKAGKDTSGTSWNGGVVLNLKVTEKEENATIMVFEFDLLMKNMTAVDSQITLNHSGKSGKKTSPFLLCLPTSGAYWDKPLHVTVTYKPTAVNSDGKVTAMEHSIRYNYEDPIISSDIYKDASDLISGSVALPNISDIDSITFALNNSFLGDAYFDNISLRLLASYTYPSDPGSGSQPDQPGGDTPTEPDDGGFVDPDTEDGVITFDKDYSNLLAISTNKDFAELNKWEVVETEGNKVLFIDKAGKDTSAYNGGVTLKLNVTKSEKNANTLVAEFDLTMKNVTGFASQITLGHKGMESSKYSPFILTIPDVKEEKLHITITYKVTATDANGTPTAIEYSIKYNNEDAVVSTDIFGSEIKNGNVALPKVEDIDKIIIALNNNFLGDAYFDNLSLSRIYVDPNSAPPHEHNFVEGKCECGETDPNYVPPHEHNFVEGKCECGETDPNYVAILTFDEIPAKSHMEITSTWADWRDRYAAEGKTMIGENSWSIVTLEDGNKVLYINKQCGGVVKYNEVNDNGTPDDTSDDTVVEKTMQDYNTGVNHLQKVMVKEANANVMIFETNILYKTITYNDVIQITLNDTSGSKNYPIFLTLKPSSAAAGSAIKFTELYWDAAKSTRVSKNAVTTDAKVGEWFTIRIEYRIVESDASGNPTKTEIKYVIGGTEIVSDTIACATPISLNSIGRVTYSFNARNVGEYYVDNSYLKLVYEEPAAPHEHNFVEGKCECGETDPNYVPPHEHNFVEGKCECGETDPNYVAPADTSVLTFDEMPATTLFTVTSGIEADRLKNETLQGYNTWEIATVGTDSNKVLHISKGSRGLGYAKNEDGTFAETLSKISTNCGVSVNLFPTKVEENANAAIFETKIGSANVTYKAGVQLRFYGGNTSTTKAPVMIYLPFTGTADGSKITYQDYHNGSAASSSEFYSKDTGAKVGDWFTLRIEYRVIEGALEVKTYVNGNLIATSNNVYGKDIVSGSYALPAASEITKVNFAFNNDFLGDFYVDDASLKLVYEEPSAEPEVPHEHNFVEGKCECGETDPNYVPPHEHNFVEGKCECGESDPNYVAPDNSVLTFDSDYSQYLSIYTDKNFAELNKWEVVETEGNKVLFIDKAGKDTSGTSWNGGVSMTVKVTKTEENANAMVFEFDITMTNIIAIDSQITMNQSGKTGKTVSPFLLSLPKDSQYRNTKLHVNITYMPTAFDADGNVTAMQYSMRINDEKATVYTELQPQASALLNGTVKIPKVTDVDSVILALNNSYLGDAYIDNISLAIVYLAPHEHEYVNGKCSCGETTEDYIEVVPFDKIPANIVWGEGTSKEIVADPTEASNNVLKVDNASKNSSGNIVTKSFYSAPVETRENADVAVFETKIFVQDANKIAYEFYLVDTSKDSKATRAVFVYFGGQDVTVFENGGSGASAKGVGLTQGKWYTIRIEYRVITDAEGKKLPETKVFVDDNCVVTSNGLYGTDYYKEVDGSKVVNNDAVPAASSLNRWRINNSSTANVGFTYFDDLSLGYKVDAK